MNYWASPVVTHQLSTWILSPRQHPSAVYCQMEGEKKEQMKEGKEIFTLYDM